MNGAIVETVLSECLHVAPVHIAWRLRELGRVVEHRAILRSNRRTFIVHERGRQTFGIGVTCSFKMRTETRPVMDESVFAIVD